MKPETLKQIVYGICLVLVLSLVTFSLYDGRAFGKPQMADMDNYFNANGQQETGTNNIVTAIVFDYRGFDTLGEASILFAAVLGVGMLFDFASNKEKKAKEEDKLST